MDDTMIDISPLLVRMCAEAGIQYDGEQMLVTKDKWQRWQAGLLREYLEGDDGEQGKVEQPEDSEAATFPSWRT